MNRFPLPKLVISLCLAFTSAAASFAHDYMIGADVSFLKQAEDNGTQFRENGEVKAGLKILRDHGYGWIRLRLFVNPDQLPNNLEYTIALAKDAKDQGFKFLLDYHYSDTWADPQKQFTPAAWVDMTHEQRVNTLREYTKDTIIAFRDAGTMPEMVQIETKFGPECYGRMDAFRKTGISLRITFARELKVSEKVVGIFRCQKSCSTMTKERMSIA